MSFDLVLSNFSCNAKKYSKTSLGSLNVYFSLLKQLDDFFVSAFIVFEFKFKNPKIFFLFKIQCRFFYRKNGIFQEVLGTPKIDYCQLAKYLSKNISLKSIFEIQGKLPKVH